MNNLFVQIFFKLFQLIQLWDRIMYLQSFFNTLTENSISCIVLLFSNRRHEQKPGKVRLNATIQTHVAKKSLLFLL